MTAVTREVLDAIRDKRIPQADTELFATFRPWRRTLAEIAAGVTPVNYAYPPYSLLRYGADVTGVIDCTSALQAACNAAAAASGFAMVTVGVSGARLKIGFAWTVDTNRTGIDFQGAYIDASSFTSGNWCSPTQSTPDVNARVADNAAHPIRNASIQGPGKQNTTAICLYLNDSINLTIAGLVFEKIGFHDWGQYVYFADGAFCNTFAWCSFAPTAGGSVAPATTYAITQTNGSNTGERNVFISCGIYNTELGAQCLNTNANIEFQNCSGDYFKRLLSVQGGTIRWFGGHIESNLDTDYWCHNTAQDGAIIIKGAQLNLTGNKTAFAMFQSDSDYGGIHLDDVFFGFGASTFTTFLIGGTGRCSVRNPMQNQGAVRPTLSLYLNRLAYGTFESASYANDWTLTAPAVRSNAQAHTGTWSLSFPGGAGVTPAANATRPCRPNQYVQGELWYLVSGITGTSGTFFIGIDFLDNNNVSLSGATQLAVTTNVGSWTRQAMKLTPPAPAGTCFVRLALTLFGAVSGTPTAYVDDVVLNLTE